MVEKEGDKGVWAINAQGQGRASYGGFGVLVGEVIRVSVGLGVDLFRVWGLAARVFVLGFEWLTTRVKKLGFDGCLGFQIGLGLLGLR